MKSFTIDKKKLIDSFPIVSSEKIWNEKKKLFYTDYSIFADKKKCPKELRVVLKWLNDNSKKVATKFVENKAKDSREFGMYGFLGVPTEMWRSLVDSERDEYQGMLEIMYDTYKEWADSVYAAESEVINEKNAIELLISKGYSVTKNQ